MARGLNVVTLIGNLGQDPELRSTQGGTAVTTLRVAVNDREKQGDDWVDVVEWVSVVVWAEQAELASKWLTKGSKIHVTGKLKTRKWQDNNGNDRYSTEVVCARGGLIFLGGNQGQGQGQQQQQNGAGQQQQQQAPQNTQQQQPQNQGQQQQQDNPYIDEEIPF